MFRRKLRLSLSCQRRLMSLTNATGLASTPPDDAGRQYLVATPAFLLEAVKLLAAHGIRATPTEAFQIWSLVYEVGSRLQERGREAAEIAFRFGINPFQLTEDQVNTLWASIETVRAMEMLDSPFGTQDPGAVYHNTMVAYRDESRARLARSAAIKAQKDKQK